MKEITNKNQKNMTTKQKKVLDYMIKWAENEIRLNEYYDGDRHIKELAEKGMIAMYGVSDPLWYGMIEAGYSSKYTNDAAYGGEKGGYSWYVWDAIDPAFKSYFKDKFEALMRQTKTYKNIVNE